MKKLLLCIATIFYSFTLSHHLVALDFTPISRTGSIVNQDKPPWELFLLLAQADIKHDGTWPSIIQATQDYWVHYIRPKGLSRRKIPRAIVQEFAAKREKLMPHFERLGLLKTIMPPQQVYDYVVIFSSFGDEMKQRIQFFSRLMANGLRAKKIILLSGERCADAKSDNLETLQLDVAYPVSLNNETDILCALYYTYDRHLFGQTELFVTPQQVNGRTPNTEDQVVDWLTKRPAPGSVLGISNQPYCARQRAALLKHLPASFTPVDIAGPQIDDDTSVALMCDTLGRTLYIEDQLRRKNPFVATARKSKL